MTVETPVFDTSDKRLQPQYARGFFLQSDDLDRVRIQAGRFTAFKEQASSSGHGDFDGYGASTAGSAIGFAGASLAASDNLSGSLFAAQLDNVWRQVYLNMNLQRAAFSLDGNLYRTRDQGRSRAGAIDTLAYSLQLKYRVGAQGFSLAYQRVHGDTPFDFVGGDSIYLANSIKYADFNGPGERSWQARYDLDLAPFGLPGLSFIGAYAAAAPSTAAMRRPAALQPRWAPMAAYRTLQGSGGKHWERDLDLRYLFASGPLKDLSLNVSHLSHRANAAQAGDDIDRLYLIVEYPLKGSL